MAKFLYVLSALCLIQIASCYVRRDVQPQQTPPSFSDLAKEAENALTDFHAKFLKFAGVDNNDQLIEKMRTETQKYATNLQGLVTQLSNEAKVQAGKADEIFQGITNQLSGTIEELKAKNPELTADATKLKEKFEESMRSVLQNTEQFTNKLQEEGKEVSSNVEDVLKKIYDNTKEAAQKIAADVEATINEKKSN